MMSNFKKYLFLSGISTTLILGLAGCGNGGGQDNGNNNELQENQQNDPTQQDDH